MANNWVVEYTDEFERWWVEQTESAQDDMDRVVRLLEREGPTLHYPYSSDIKGSAIALRELRIQSDGHPTAFFMPLIPCDRHYFCSAETKQETIDGMKRTFPSPNDCLPNI